MVLVNSEKDYLSIGYLKYKNTFLVYQSNENEKHSNTY